MEWEAGGGGRGVSDCFSPLNHPPSQTARQESRRQEQKQTRVLVNADIEILTSLMFGFSYDTLKMCLLPFCIQAELIVIHMFPHSSIISKRAAVVTQALIATYVLLC